MSIPTMIFAAGFGTRMASLTADTPKPLLKVSGRALVDHTLDLIDGFERSQIIVNAHYHAEQVVSHFDRTGIRVHVETPDILDTGGGLRAALPMFDRTPSRVLTMNSDVIWRGENPVEQLLQVWDSERMDGLLACVHIDDCLGRSDGDLTIGSNGNVTWGGRFVYGGIGIVKPDLLSEFSEKSFSLKCLWDLFAENQRLYGVRIDAKWCDVGRPEGIAQAEQLIDQFDV